ncbi:MAG: hypothetical protein ACYS47_07685 [Planctomycetota bacterium]|jgi:hypothetical protein
MVDWIVTHIFHLGTIVVFFPYFFGSRRFYLGKPGFMLLIGIAIALDIGMAVATSLGAGPGETEKGIPTSPLFYCHISLAGFGLLGFFIMFIGLLIFGWRKEYPRLRKFQYWVLLPSWVVGTSIAFLNFVVRECCGKGMYG